MTYGAWPVKKADPLEGGMPVFRCFISLRESLLMVTERIKKLMTGKRKILVRPGRQLLLNVCGSPFGGEEKGNLGQVGNALDS